LEFVKKKKKRLHGRLSSRERLTERGGSLVFEKRNGAPKTPRLFVERAEKEKRASSLKGEGSLGKMTGKRSARLRRRKAEKRGKQKKTVSSRREAADRQKKKETARFAEEQERGGVRSKDAPEADVQRIRGESPGEGGGTGKKGKGALGTDPSFGPHFTEWIHERKQRKTPMPGKREAFSRRKNGRGWESQLRKRPRQENERRV